MNLGAKAFFSPLFGPLIFSLHEPPRRMIIPIMKATLAEHLDAVGKILLGQGGRGIGVFLIGKLNVDVISLAFGRHAEGEIVVVADGEVFGRSVRMGDDAAHARGCVLCRVESEDHDVLFITWRGGKTDGARDAVSNLGGKIGGPRGGPVGKSPLVLAVVGDFGDGVTKWFLTVDNFLRHG